MSNFSSDTFIKQYPIQHTLIQASAHSDLVAALACESPMPQHVQRQLAASLYMKVGQGVVMDYCDGCSSREDDVATPPGTTAPASARDAGAAANSTPAATGNFDGARSPGANRQQP
eukprot:6177802-Pleurochrysis_carterae.AAC.1